ncbi:class I SAM-dependent methyltransferase [Komagataeibacter intermedius]|uniref:class I SAM-dependent methyltransferase n=1 Tax=Komagataeibacter intermedius TaxID=66229 RepID=UPI003B437299
MTPLTPRQIEAVRRNLRMMDARTDWDSITGPQKRKDWPFPDYETLFLPGGQRVPFIEGRV